MKSADKFEMVRALKASKSALPAYLVASALTLSIALMLGGIGAWALFVLTFGILCGDVLNILWCRKKLREMESVKSEEVKLGS